MSRSSVAATVKHNDQRHREGRCHPTPFLCRCLVMISSSTSVTEGLSGTIYGWACRKNTRRYRGTNLAESDPPSRTSSLKLSGLPNPAGEPTAGRRNLRRALPHIVRSVMLRPMAPQRPGMCMSTPLAAALRDGDTIGANMSYWKITGEVSVWRKGPSVFSSCGWR